MLDLSPIVIAIALGVVVLALLALAVVSGRRLRNDHARDERDAAERRAERDRLAREHAEETARERREAEAEARRQQLELRRLERETENDRRAFELQHEKVVVDNAEVTEARVVQIGTYRSLDVKKVPAAVTTNQKAAIEKCKETALNGPNLTTGRGAEHVRADAEVELARGVGRGGFFDAVAKAADAGARKAAVEAEMARRVQIVQAAAGKEAGEKKADEKVGGKEAIDPNAELKAELEKTRVERDKTRAELEAARKAAEGKKDAGKEAGDKGKGGEPGKGKAA